MTLPEELVREFQEPEEKVREAIFLALSLFPGLRVLGSGWPIRVGAPGSRGVTISAIGMDPFHTRVVISSGLESTLMRGIEVALGALRHLELLVDGSEKLIGGREVRIGDEHIGNAGILLQPLGQFARQGGFSRPHRSEHQRQPAFGGDRPLGLLQSQIVGGRDI